MVDRVTRGHVRFDDFLLDEVEIWEFPPWKHLFNTTVYRTTLIRAIIVPTAVSVTGREGGEYGDDTCHCDSSQPRRS